MAVDVVRKYKFLVSKSWEKYDSDIWYIADMALREHVIPLMDAIGGNFRSIVGMGSYWGIEINGKEYSNVDIGIALDEGVWTYNEDGSEERGELLGTEELMNKLREVYELLEVEIEGMRSDSLGTLMHSYIDGEVTSG